MSEPQILAMPVMTNRYTNVNDQEHELIESTYLSLVTTSGFTVCSMLKSSRVPTVELQFNWALPNDDF